MKVVAKEIDCIAHFMEDGTIHPMRIRLEDKRVIKIDKIISQEKENLAGSPMVRFLCSTTINDTEKLLELKFGTKTYKWMLFKM